MLLSAPKFPLSSAAAGTRSRKSEQSKNPQSSGPHSFRFIVSSIPAGGNCPVGEPYGARGYPLADFISRARRAASPGQYSKSRRNLQEAPRKRPVRKTGRTEQGMYSAKYTLSELLA